MKRENALIVAVAVMASLLEIIDTSIVNVALPSMMGNLGATLEDISMVITGYAIANAIVLPLSAWLSERVGRRRYYLTCIAAFTITSVACGFAPNLTSLIVFRILQGLAGGALLPTSQALIYEQFPKEKAGMAGAIFGMSVMIGPTLGPVLGGYLTDQFGWRSIFNVNLPLGLLTLAAGMLVIRNRKRDESEGEFVNKFDAMGMALLVAGIGCLQFVLERGEADDWFESKSIILTSIVAVITLPLFVWWELKVENPIINLRLFKQSIVTCGVCLMAGLGFYLYALIFIIPIFVGRVFHFDATQTGELFIPGSILTAMMMPFIGNFMQKGVNPKRLIFIGFMSCEICVWLVTMLSPQSGLWDMWGILFVRGFALAFLFVPINSGILSQFKGANLGQVSGLLNLFRQLGGSMGIAAIATLTSINTHQNMADLSTKVSALRPETYSQIAHFDQTFKSKPLDQVGLGTPDAAAKKLIHARMENQAFMMSFLQVAWFLLIVFSLVFIPLYFIKFNRFAKPVLDAH